MQRLDFFSSNRAFYTVTSYSKYFSRAMIFHSLFEIIINATIIYYTVKAFYDGRKHDFLARTIA